MLASGDSVRAVGFAMSHDSRIQFCQNTQPVVGEYASGAKEFGYHSFAEDLRLSVVVGQVWSGRWLNVQIAARLQHQRSPQTEDEI